jgi:hypothetical protein
MVTRARILTVALWVAVAAVCVVLVVTGVSGMIVKGR